MVFSGTTGLRQARSGDGAKRAYKRLPPTAHSVVALLSATRRGWSEAKRSKVRCVGVPPSRRQPQGGPPRSRFCRAKSIPSPDLSPVAPPRLGFRQRRTGPQAPNASGSELRPPDTMNLAGSLGGHARGALGQKVARTATAPASA